jgi:hypothetical protein
LIKNLYLLYALEAKIKFRKTTVTLPIALILSLGSDLEQKPAHAFTINPSSGGALNTYNALVGPYNVANFSTSPVEIGTAITSLNPDLIQQVRLGGTSNFLAKLQQQYGSLGWQFSSSSTPLDGTLNINHYYACGLTTSLCGAERGFGISDIVGAFLDLTFVRGSNDPQDSKLHWIQYINTVEPGHDSQNTVDFILRLINSLQLNSFVHKLSNFIA